MLNKITKMLLITSFIIVASSGCSSKLYDAETLHEKGAHLTKITRKVKVAIRNKVADTELLTFIENKYPQDMMVFSDYYISMKNHEGTAIVLMCDKEKTKALLEDLSCTGALEGGYNFKKNLSCDFHLNVEEECAK